MVLDTRIYTASVINIWEERKCTYHVQIDSGPPHDMPYLIHGIRQLLELDESFDGTMDTSFDSAQQSSLLKESEM